VPNLQEHYDLAVVLRFIGAAFKGEQPGTDDIKHVANLLAESLGEQGQHPRKLLNFKKNKTPRLDSLEFGVALSIEALMSTGKRQSEAIKLVLSSPAMRNAFDEWAVLRGDYPDETTLARWHRDLRDNAKSTMVSLEHMGKHCDPPFSFIQDHIDFITAKKK
jgi:hypothetical protein